MAENPATGQGRQQAILAAILAVQRGHLNAEEAASALAGLGEGDAPEPAQAASLLLDLVPATSRAELAREARDLAPSPEAAKQALEKLGVGGEQAATLFSFAPAADTTAREDARATLAKTLVTAAAAFSSDAPTKAPAQEGAKPRHVTGRAEADRYTIKHEHARGGMGRVLVAIDNAIGREVALKELLPQRGQRGSHGSPFTPQTSAGALAERFLREARITGQLEHPNIVPVYEIATRPDGSVFYTMKFVRGRTLAARLRSIASDTTIAPEKRLAERLKLLEQFLDICQAVAYAHSRGVIHRDLKPSNVMMGDFGETLVLDWGLARVKGQDDQAAKQLEKRAPGLTDSLLHEDASSRTLDGSVLGTPAYMPPEQAAGRLPDVDEQSDVYALGAILYEIVSGRQPYEGDNAQVVLAQVIAGPPPPLAAVEPAAPRELAALVASAMARDKASRLASARALADEVRAFRDGRALSVYRYSSSELLWRFVRRNRAVVTAAGVALALLVVGALIAYDNIRRERDAAQDALAVAQREREGRERLQREKDDEWARLIRERQAEITRQDEVVRELRPEAVLAEAKALLAKPARTPADDKRAPEVVRGVLNAALAMAELHRLRTEPVAGRDPGFLAPEVCRAQQHEIREARLVAAHLAISNQDYALAEFVLNGTDLTPDRLSLERRRLSEARSALMVQRAAAINAALADIRDDLARHGRGRDLPSLEEYIFRIGGFRERQTVNLLAMALEPYVSRARFSGAEQVYTQPERDELTLILRVLGQLELPDLTVGPLSEFLEVVRDQRLGVEAGLALCMTASPLAEAPLLALRDRVGERSMAWTNVSRRFGRVPDPPGRPAPVTAAEHVERSRVLRAKGRDAEALALAREAVKIEPGNAAAWYNLGRSEPAVDTCLEALEKARALGLDDAPLHSLRALLCWRKADYDQGILAAREAILRDPGYDQSWNALGLNLIWKGEREKGVEAVNQAIRLAPWFPSPYVTRAAALFELADYERATADCTRALEIDPRMTEAWINRALCRTKLGELAGAELDFARALELAPRHPWALVGRANLFLERGLNEKALEDYDAAIQHAGALDMVWAARGEALARMGDVAGAVSDYEQAVARANGLDRPRHEKRLEELRKLKQ